MRNELCFETPPEVMTLDHVRLRRPKVSDARAVFAYASDPEVTRYMDWPTSKTLESVIERLELRAEEWRTGAAFCWVITLPTADEAIGTISLKVAETAAEFGYLLNRRFWGNGYATEASRALVDWAFTIPKLWRVSATCDTQNLASARVLEKCGMSREGVLRRAIVRPNLSNVPRDAFLYARVREPVAESP